jgi:hypothetical protein
LGTDSAGWPTALLAGITAGPPPKLGYIWSKSRLIG